MAATPKVAGVYFRGSSGKAYSVSMYCSDVVGALNTISLDGAAGTGSPNFWIAPEDVVLMDAAVPTGLADTTVWKALANDTPTGNVLMHAAYVNTLANRPSPGIGYRKGTKISFTQA